MYIEIQKCCDSLFKKARFLPEERKTRLLELSNAIQRANMQYHKVQLLFVCTHNSRRSHFGQVWASVAAAYFGINNVHTFSAGTEITAVHSNVLKALGNQGFQISVPEVRSINPAYVVSFGTDGQLICFSKLVSDLANPSEHFTAIMTCSEAELNCPIVPGAEQRIAITYEDPKLFDGTPEADRAYLQRSEQIATEMLYVFSQIKGRN